MKELTQKEIEKAFKEGIFKQLKYMVDVEGKQYISDFTYGGLRDCQWFIHENGKPNKQYIIKVVRDES